MDDSDFLDLIYSLWASTTGAENMFWMYEKLGRGHDVLYEMYAVDQEQEQHFVASFNSDEDADFITAVHGCFPDLIRKTREALDEADRLDAERDEQEGRIAELEMEVDDKSDTLMHAQDTLALYRREISDKTHEIDILNERLLSYGERLKEAEATSEGLAIENREMERWLDNGGPERPATDCGLGER